MIVTAGPGAVREFLVVLALALTGLLLALVAAFAPWYDAPGDPGRGNVVELHAPSRAADGVEVTALVPG
jgi:hypothetical protein